MRDLISLLRRALIVLPVVLFKAVSPSWNANDESEMTHHSEPRDSAPAGTAISGSRMAEARAHDAISTDGTPIRFYEWGEGPALLFVHGTTADHRSWIAISKHLVDHFTVFAMDRRGRGESGDAHDYGLAREVEDVAAVVEAIGEPVSLFGHSFGGAVSLEAALVIDQVERLILYEPVNPAGMAELSEGILDRIRAMIDADELERAMEDFLREVAQMTEEELQAYRRSPLWESRIPLIRTVPREMAAEEIYEFDPERFAGFNAPTMLLTGENSPAFYQIGVEMIHAALPDSEVVILGRQQHVAHLTDPGAVAGKVKQFLMR